jgi:hypothetical protein
MAAPSAFELCWPIPLASRSRRVAKIKALVLQLQRLRQQLLLHLHPLLKPKLRCQLFQHLLQKNLRPTAVDWLCLRLKA